MDLETLTSFFQWCLVINLGFLAFWTAIFLAAPDLVYRTQSRWFPQSRDTFSLVFYCLIGFYKVLVMVFVLVPYLALRIIG